MKLISFLHNGTASYGIVNGDDVLDLTPLLGAQAPDLKTLIAKNLFAAATQAASAHSPTLKFSQLTLLPVIPNPGQIFCIGLNYGEHVRETGREITEVPTIFLRLPESQVAHGQDILRPAESHRLDYEAEIAIVIGKGGRRIKEEDAWNHIAGYSCYNDGSVRDWQVATSQWTPGTNAAIEHIAIADSIALLLVAPATANVIGKFANGIADDRLPLSLRFAIKRKLDAMEGNEVAAAVRLGESEMIRVDVDADVGGRGRGIAR